jgi:hypothetical protein
MVAILGFEMNKVRPFHPEINIMSMLAAHVAEIALARLP